MTERLVDVMDGSGNVLHTYPITLSESGNAPTIPNTRPRRWKRQRTAGLCRTLNSAP